jgi:multidrug efflux pump
VAIAVSLAVSLTTTPMMCAHMLRERKSHGWLYRLNERCFKGVVSMYGWTLTRVLRHPAITLAVLFGTIGLNVYLFIHVPKGFFPQQDNGRMMGVIQADQDTSFQAMQERLHTMMEICRNDPEVANIGGSAGGNFSLGTNTARIYMSLKSPPERKVSIDLVMARLRQKLSVVPGASLYMQASQDLRIGGRGSFSLYQFTMRGDNLADLGTYGPAMLAKMRSIPLITDVNTDQQNKGLQSTLTYDRREASRYGISPQLIDNTLYDAFGQRQVSTMYGGCAGVLAESENPGRYLCALAGRSTGSFGRFRALRAGQYTSGREPPGPVSGGHRLF